MRTVANDRRTRRSERPDQALYLQLDTVRDEAGLDALVLATEEGLPVAHSGEDDLCEEIAALAPFLCGRATPAIDAETMRVHQVNLEQLSLLLVAYQIEPGKRPDRWLEHASQGIERILAI